MEWLAPWLWARYRDRYAGILIFQLLFWPFFVIFVGMVGWAVALHHTFGEFLYVGGGFLVVAETCGGLAILWSTRVERPLLNRWGRGDHTDPRRTRDALFRLSRVPVLYGLAGGLPMLVVAPLLGWSVGDPLEVNIAMALAAMSLMVGSGLLGWVIAEAALWPVQAEIDAVLEDDGRIRTHRTLHARLLFLVLLGTLMGSWTAALLTSWAETNAGQYVLAPIVALPLSLAVAVVLAPFGVGPVVRPMADLREGTERVAAGILTDRVPVTSDDEFGQLIRSFNRMQGGLLDRERLQTAFGSYVDPLLAQRLIDRGSELFEGEEAEATVMFVDVRGFTSYSQGRSPGETVARLNELFSIVVPILRQHGGHANKFLGDGMLAVFGVPEEMPDHADRAVAAAVAIQAGVHERFGDDLSVGIGMSSGQVIAGTVGGGGKLEFTLVGDTVNVAHRVEELTKTTGDPVLLSGQTVAALFRPVATVSRGEQALRGRAGNVELHALLS